MLPSCFSNSTAGHRHKQPPESSLITCTYRTQLFNSSTLLNLTWSKTLNSHTLTVHSPDLFSFTISLYPSIFSMFRTRPGCKSVSLANTQNSDSTDKLKFYWDFTKAEFDRVNSAEPTSSFYFAFTHCGRVVFFIGDRDSRMTRRVNSAESILVSRREHLFGRRSYSTTANFMNSKHDIEIECGGGTMKLKIDGKTKVVVKRLGWKFRGNERISIGGLEVEFFWDVFNWVSKDNNNNSGNGVFLFNWVSKDNNNNSGNGVFVFQVGEGGGVWPEMVGPEKKLMKKRSSPATVSAARGVVSPAPSWSSSVLQWAEESGECGRSLGSNLNSLTSYGGDGGGTGDGFSLVLYAWRRD